MILRSLKRCGRRNRGQPRDCENELFAGEEEIIRRNLGTEYESGQVNRNNRDNREQLNIASIN